MERQLSVRGDSFALATPFRISRGVKTAADVVTVTIREGDAIGRGEGVPYPRYGESPDAAIAAIEAIRPAIEAGADRAVLTGLLPAGAARNAVDCALWDLEARLAGRSVADRAGVKLDGIATAITVGLETPDAMRRAASAITDVPLIKIKVDAGDPVAQIDAVRGVAPDARLIVDPNESWSPDLLRAMQPHLLAARVDLLEQPLPAGADDALAGFRPAVPICADESVHDLGDLDRVAARYQAINVKLDKSGGLTAALDLAAAARERRLGLMVGCMICSSLSIAPALVVAAAADFVDLDGPLWLAADREGGIRAERGLIAPPASGFWGGA